MVPALKSRAKLTRSLPRPGKRRLHYFFKDHESRARLTWSLRRRSGSINFIPQRKDFGLELSDQWKAGGLRACFRRALNVPVTKAEFRDRA